MKYNRLLFSAVSLSLATFILTSCDNVNEFTYNYGDTVYTWSDDYTKCTATKICFDDATRTEIEEVDTTKNVKPATCEEKEVTTYKAEFTNEAFSEQTKEIETKDALGHNWDEVTYTWNDDYTKCTAKRVCLNDSAHVETEEADTLVDLTQELSCTTDEMMNYTVVFNNPAFIKQEKDGVKTKEALGHKWDEATYTWDSDYSKCTAKRVCLNDPNHIESETQYSYSSRTRDRSCTGDELTTFEVSFENEAFAPQTKSNIETKDALGHNWGEATYSWNDDYTKCIATRVCLNDATHIETEEVDTTKNVKPATCEEKEVTTYKAVFTNEAFTEQTKEIETKAALGHNYEIKYSWNDDYTKCIATRVCLNDATHVETEEVDTTKSVKPATCEEKEVTTYKAAFINEAFTEQTKEIETNDALGHNYEIKYSWNDNYSKCTATKVCLNDATHVALTEEGVVTTITNPATCEGNGKVVYTATFTNEEFVTQTKEETLAALGHNYKIKYSWNSNNTKCIATRVCSNDSKDVLTEEGVVIKSNSSKCGENEITTYTATFENEAFTTQTRETGHSNSNLSYDKENKTYSGVCSVCGKNVEGSPIDVEAKGEYTTTSPYDVVPGNTYYYHSASTTSTNYNRFKITEATTMTIDFVNVDNAANVMVMVQLWNDEKRLKTYTGARGNSFSTKYEEFAGYTGETSKIAKQVTFNFTEEFVGNYIYINIYCGGAPTSILVNYSYMAPEKKVEYKELNYKETTSITLSGNYSENPAESPDVYKFVASEDKKYSITLSDSVSIYRNVNGKLEEFLIDVQTFEFNASKDEEFIFVFVAPVEDEFSFDVTIADELPKVLSIGHDAYFYVSTGSNNFAVITIDSDVLEGHYKLSCDVGSTAFSRANVKITLNDEQIYYSSLSLLEEDTTIPNLTFKAGDVIKIYGIEMMDIDGTLKLTPVEE